MYFNNIEKLMFENKVCVKSENIYIEKEIEKDNLF